MGGIWPNRWSWHAAGPFAVSGSLRWPFAGNFVYFGIQDCFRTYMANPLLIKISGLVDTMVFVSFNLERLKSIMMRYIFPEKYDNVHVKSFYVSSLKILFLC